MVSKYRETDSTPARGTRFTVGRSTNRPALVPGVMRDPTVSVPNATGAKPALTDTAEPVDDPAGVYMSLANVLPREAIVRLPNAQVAYR
jgi:hypothetical protein